MQDQAPASAGESGTEGPRHELTGDYERSDGQFFSVALAGIAAGQPGGTGLGLANEGGITIEMSGSRASWQNRPYQQEVTLTNPPSWATTWRAARLPGLSSCPARWPAGSRPGSRRTRPGRPCAAPA